MYKLPYNARYQEVWKEKNGELRKTCLKLGNGEKRALPVFDTWDGFISELRCSQQQNSTLNLSKTFSLDHLPVHFGVKLARNEFNVLDRQPLNGAMRELVLIIRQAYDYRFWHRRTTFDSGLVYEYHCSQDSAQASQSTSTGKRDVRQMERYTCQSRLRLRPSLEDRTITLKMHHLPHNAYNEIQLSPRGLEFVSERVTTSTPSQIFRQLRDSSLADADHVTQGQIYYQWQKANARTWRRDGDQFLSSTLLLEEAREDYDYRVLREGNVRGLAMYPKKLIAAVVANAKELAMDATYGTNSAGMELSAVLAEVDGTGVPVAYCFLEKLPAENGNRQSQAGATTRVLAAVLQQLKDVGFRPTFFGCDKDQAEINAIKSVFETVTIQLCYWHAKRAVRTKLRDSKQTDTQGRYVAETARSLIPTLEICWGTPKDRRPEGEHKKRECSCESKSVDFAEKGSVETSAPVDRDTVLDMFCRHFNAHPLIPDKNGIYRSPQVIYEEAAMEMYTWCRVKGFYRLWAYLFVNWYQSGSWEIWARSANATEIPILKTTMIVASHWRKIKHDYLHQFNRPRIDMVLWILTTRVIPDASRKLLAIIQGDHRQGLSSWRIDFKKEWKAQASKAVNERNLNTYHTEPTKCVCSCDAFMHSRFLICKHIVWCYEPIRNYANFQSTVNRQRTQPFWTDNQLSLRDTFKGDQAISDQDLFSGSEGESVVDYEQEDDDNDDEEEEEDEGNVDKEGSLQVLENPPEVNNGVRRAAAMRLAEQMEEAAAHIRQQAQLDQFEFVDRVEPDNRKNVLLVEEIAKEKNRRTTGNTWGQRKHPAVMYYRWTS